MDTNQFKDALVYLEEKWHSKIGLIFSIFITIIMFGMISNILNLSGDIKSVLFIFFLIAIIVFWFYSNFYITKTKKNKLGFLISIICDSKETHIKFKQDFIDTLHRMIRGSSTGKNFQFIELPQHQAKRIINEDDALKLRLKSKCRFILYGRIRDRIINGKGHYFLELNGTVAHKPISTDMSKEFGQEFSELLPRRLQISKHNDIYAFEFTSEWTSIVSKYIISVAAFISGDLDFSLEMFIELEEYLNDRRSTEFNAISKIKDRVPEFIGSNYMARAAIEFDLWVNNKSNVEHLKSSENNLDKIPKQYQDKQEVYIFRSVLVFLRCRDIDESIKILNKVRNKDSLWYFNAAFLFAYAGDLKKSIQNYRKAIRLNLEPRKIIEIEEFMHWILENENDKYQLYYCLGFLNWKIKDDLVQAKVSFCKFLEKCKNGEYVKETKLTQSWLNNIEDELNKN